MKKKLILSLAVVFTLALVFTACGDLTRLEWETLPNSVYAISGETPTDAMLESVTVKINNKSYTLKEALTLPDVSYSGFDTTTKGQKIITVTYKTLTIYYTYEVVDSLPGGDPVEADTTWYGDGTASTYTLSTIEDLYGLAELVNDGTATFAGKTVKLGVDIDLTEQVWTPIGEGARKGVESLTFAQLKAAKTGGNFPLAEEEEAAYIVRLNAFTLKYGKYAYLGQYYYAKYISDTVYEYYFSDSNDLSGNFFAGTFDGQGRTIKGLSDIGYTPKNPLVYANSSGVIEGYAFGLFGVVIGDVTIKNLTFTDVAITGAYYQSGEMVNAEIDSVGAAIGYGAKDAGSITIDNVKVTSGEISAFAAAGGIVGRIYTLGNVIVKDSENRANITTSEHHAGGLVGFIGSTGGTATFTNNTNYGNIQGQNANDAGAILRDSNVGAIFTNCRNFGNVKTANKDNGVTGYTNAKYTFTECVNYGTLS